MRAVLPLVVAGVAALCAQPGSARAPGTPTEAGGPVGTVVVGVPGLSWSDLERDDLPALRGLWEQGAVACQHAVALLPRDARHEPDHDPRAIGGSTAMCLGPCRFSGDQRRTGGE